MQYDQERTYQNYLDGNFATCFAAIRKGCKTKPDKLALRLARIAVRVGHGVDAHNFLDRFEASAQT
ncbi:MAG: hypothetical protein L3J47_00105 [Sulfurovum sp.]|nr:hypothetical protein [Sulfurovum sp.]